MAANGSMWVEGNYLYWRNAANTRFRFLGTTVATPAGAKLGSLWIEANNVHYIDASGVERRANGSAVAQQTGKAGSMWVETAYSPSSANGQLHFLGESQYEHWLHEDVAAVASHTDTPHSDGSPHSDAHTDTPFSNSHTDNPFSNSHTDTSHVNTHSDTPHTDIPHCDVPYTNGTAPHDDYTDQSHSDSYANAHDDEFGDEAPHIDNHSDSYQNAHTDEHLDAGGQHIDDGGCNTGFTDIPFANGHSDTPFANSHDDTPFSNSHADSAFANSHTDTTTHSDVAFSNAHSDIPHTDKPESV